VVRKGRKGQVPLKPSTSKPVKQRLWESNKRKRGDRLSLFFGRRSLGGREVGKRAVCVVLRLLLTESYEVNFLQRTKGGEMEDVRKCKP